MTTFESKFSAFSPDHAFSAPSQAQRDPAGLGLPKRVPQELFPPRLSGLDRTLRAKFGDAFIAAAEYALQQRRKEALETVLTTPRDPAEFMGEDVVARRQAIQERNANRQALDRINDALPGIELIAAPVFAQYGEFAMHGLVGLDVTPSRPLE